MWGPALRSHQRLCSSTGAGLLLCSLCPASRGSAAQLSLGIALGTGMCMVVLPPVSPYHPEPPGKWTGREDAPGAVPVCKCIAFIITLSPQADRTHLASDASVEGAA